MLRAPLLRPMAAAAAVLTLASCSLPDADLAGPVDPIGEFRLGYNIVVSEGVDKVEPSRDVSEAEWKRAFTEAIDERFSRYDGDQLYHIAVSVNGYSIAVGGIPVVAPLKSVAIIGVSIWDDAAGGKLNPEPEVMVVYERLVGEDVVIGSGVTLSKEEQVENIARNGARLIEKWMRENPEWFAARPGAASDVRIERNEVVSSGG